MKFFFMQSIDDSCWHRASAGDLQPLRDAIRKFPPGISWRTNLSVEPIFRSVGGGRPNLDLISVLAKDSKLCCLLIRIDRYKQSLMHFAALHDSIELAEILLSVWKAQHQKKDPNQLLDQLDGERKTPLYCTARNDSRKMAQWLLQNGTQALDICDNEGNTPLFLAALRYNLDLVEILADPKSHSMNPNSYQAHRFLFQLVETSECPLALRLLLQLWNRHYSWWDILVALHRKEARGRTLLHFAIHGKMMLILLQSGCRNFDVIDEYRQTAVDRLFHHADHVSRQDGYHILRTVGTKITGSAPYVLSEDASARLRFRIYFKISLTAMLLREC